MSFLGGGWPFRAGHQPGALPAYSGRRPHIASLSQGLYFLTEEQTHAHLTWDLLYLCKMRGLLTLFPQARFLSLPVAGTEKCAHRYRPDRSGGVAFTLGTMLSASGSTTWLMCCFMGMLIGWGQNYCLRFYGNGVNDIDRVKVPLDAPPTKADVGGDFTIEFQMRAQVVQNPSGTAATSGPNDDWTLGHVIVDRDIFGAGDYGDYGISLAGGRIAFGVNNGAQSYTLISNMVVADDNWHHIAVTRSATGGTLQIFIDGVLDNSQITSVTGDISYRDGRSTTWPNDPFIVLGAEKHDYDNTQYPSYSGYLDELRISNIVRYTSSYTPVNRFYDDVNTVLLYHFDEGTGTLVRDSALLAGPSTDGQIQFGGSPQGPIWFLRDGPLAYAPETLHKPALSSPHLYPNPCDDEVWLILPHTNTPFYAKIFDPKGVVLQELSLEDVNPHRLKLHKYPSGWYFIQIQSVCGTVVYQKGIYKR